MHKAQVKFSRKAIAIPLKADLMSFDETNNVSQIDHLFQ